MALDASEMVFFRALAHHDGETNGGRMGAQQVVSGVKNNLLPDVTQAERTAGVVRYRKMFAAVRDSEGGRLEQVLAHLTAVASAYQLRLFAGTQRDVQSVISSPREYAAGALAENASAGDVEIAFDLADAAMAACFADGDAIWIGNGSGGEYFRNVSFSITGTEVTAVLASGDQLASGYTAGAAVASCLECDAVEALADNWSETSVAGTYDEVAHPVELDNMGTVEDDVTVTFTSATTFMVTGAYAGTLATGAITADYAPANPAGGVYFTLRAAGWGGTWAAGDRVSFSIHPAALPLWIKQVVAAGAAAAAAETIPVQVAGEVA